MRRLNPLVVIALTALPLAAQESALVGVVRDSSTGRPLAGAVISIPQASLRTVSDQRGIFRLKGIETGDHTVFVRHEAFEPWAMRVRLSVEDDRDVALGVIRLAPAYRAVFFGTVIDSITEEGLANARVSIEEQLIESRTDADGHFELPGLKSGGHTVRIRRVGYDPWSVSINLEVPEPMRVNFGEIKLTPAEAVTLEDIVVEGEEFRASMLMRDFMTRMHTEQGTFITYEDIERIDPVNTSDIFRTIPGMNTLGGGQIISARGAGSMQGFEPCTVQYYLDGVKVSSDVIDVVMPDVIAGIEIYNGSATIPHIFRSQSNANCGVIAVWMKDGGAR